MTKSWLRSRSVYTRFTAVVNILSLAVKYREVTQLFQAIETLEHRLAFDTLKSSDNTDNVNKSLHTLCTLVAIFLMQTEEHKASLELARDVQMKVERLIETL